MDTPPDKTPSCRGKAKTFAFWALLALNAVLVMVLADKHLPDNRAQAIGGVNPTDVLAVPGKLSGFPNGIVFLMDGHSGLLTAISYDGPSGKVQALSQPIDIARLVNTAGGVRGGR